MSFDFLVAQPRHSLYTHTASGNLLQVKDLQQLGLFILILFFLSPGNSGLFKKKFLNSPIIITTVREKPVFGFRRGWIPRKKEEKRKKKVNVYYDYEA